MNGHIRILDVEKSFPRDIRRVDYRHLFTLVSFTPKHSEQRAQPVAWNPRLWARLPQVGAVLDSVTKNQRTGPDYRAVSNPNLVANGRVDTDKAVSSDLNVTGNDGVRCYEAIVTNFNMVANQTAAPDNRVTTERNKRLQ